MCAFVRGRRKSSESLKFYLAACISVKYDIAINPLFRLLAETIRFPFDTYFAKPAIFRLTLQGDR